MKSQTITLCPTLYWHKLSDLNQCSLKGKNIYCGPYLLRNSEKFSHREICRALLIAGHENNEFSREMIFIDLADGV